MSGPEFVEWMAFDMLEPLGEQHADLRAALICKVLADINTPAGKRRTKLTDFMLNFERETATPEEMMAQAEMANLAFGGMDLREGENT